MTEHSLKHKTTISLFWSFIDKFGQQVINLISGIILMRTLAPSEYGLIGALTVFIAFSSILIDSGFTRSLLNRRSISDDEYSTVFYFNLGFSVLLYLILFALAPSISEIFHEPRIKNISRVLFISFIFNGTAIIQQTLLIKKADFKGISKINLASLLIAATVAITMALNGKGVWSLIMQTLVYSFFRSLLLWIYSKWKPVKSFSIKLLRSFAGLSNKLLLTSLINAVFNNIYPSIIAFFYPNSMNSVGYYSQANKYQNIPFSIISDSFRTVSTLILPEIKHETDRLRNVISKMIKSVAFLTFPIGFWMILSAEPAFEFLFKDKWLPAVPYFKVLCIAGIISPFIHIMNELFISREKANYFLGVEIIRRIILVLLIALLFRYGIMGLATSWVIYTYITIIISLILSKRLINYTIYLFLKDILPYALIALISTFIAYHISNKIESNLLFLLVSVAVITITYLSLCRIFKLEMVKEIKNWFNSNSNKENQL